MPTGKLVAGVVVVMAIAAPAAGSLHQAGGLGAPHAYHSRTIVRDPADVKGGLDIRAVSLGQTGREVRFSVTTWDRLRAGRLGATDGDRLCAVLTRARRELCFGRSHRAMVLYKIGAGGKPYAHRRVAATVRFGARSATARLDLSAAGLSPGRIDWQMRASSHAAACGPTGACLDLAPDRRPARTRLAAVRLVGCRVPHRRLYRHGSRSRKTIAVTFDDGPGAYSRSVLAILRRKHVHATFFVIGRQVRPRADTARRALAAGHVLGNHSWNHANLARGGARAAGQIAATQRVIAATTGFVPCVFRPPYGAGGSSLVAAARSHGVATINWDVDPRDWSRPGSGSIYSRIVQRTHRGSIVLMHDGGGPRSQTVAALPHVIDTLRRHGYSFVTVPELLGGSLIYGH